MATHPFSTFPSIDFSKLPKFDLTKFDITTFDLTTFDPQAVITSAKDTARDAAYITVGLGVLGYQKAQVRRREFAKALTDQFSTGRAQIDEVVDVVEARLAALEPQLVAFEGKLEAAVGNLEKRLPEPVGALLNTAHTTAKSARKQVRDLISSPA